MSRRQFGAILGAGLLSTFTGCQSSEGPQSTVPIEERLSELFGSLPGGLSAAAVNGESLIWSGGVGFADIDNKMPMTADFIQNIASISKTVTATSIMQLWEKGAFKLDDDINGFLPFKIRNPLFPDEPITFRQLLAHRSSIKDGPSYDKSYACGDPAVSLADWIQGYFSLDGDYYDSRDNFHSWAPGTLNPPESPRAYSNVAYGLLGFLVEQMTEELFSNYCREHIFGPLQMQQTGWHLSEVDQSRHVKLYSALPESNEELYLAAEGVEKPHLAGDVYSHCLYSFYNYPDGLLRTNVKDLSRFLRAYINWGSLNGRKILEKDTVQIMLSEKHYGRALCWDGDGDIWSHDGGDPGVATYMAFTRKENLGIILFFNAGEFSDYTNEIVLELYKTARSGA